MSSWSNSTSQQIGVGSGMFTVVNFDQVVVPGSNPLSVAGNFTYSYHVYLVQSSGTFGPTNTTAVLVVNNEVQMHTRTFLEIDTGSKGALSHTGELRQLSIGDLITVRIHTNEEHTVDIPLMKTSPNRCTLTLRKVAGAGT